MGKKIVLKKIQRRENIGITVSSTSECITKHTSLKTPEQSDEEGSANYLPVAFTRFFLQHFFRTTLCLWSLGSCSWPTRPPATCTYRKCACEKTHRVVMSLANAWQHLQKNKASTCFCFTDSAARWGFLFPAWGRIERKRKHKRRPKANERHSRGKSGADTDKHGGWSVWARQPKCCSSP